LAGGVIDRFTATDVDGQGQAAVIVFAKGLATDLAGNIYFAEDEAGTIRKITPGGSVTTLVGTPGKHFGYRDGPAATALFNSPAALTVDTAGNIFVADAGNYRIRKITTDGMVTTFAGSGLHEGVDGVGTAASFDGPNDIHCDLNGNLYVADVTGIRKITPDGVVTTIAVVPYPYGVSNLA